MVVRKSGNGINDNLETGDSKFWKSHENTYIRMAFMDAGGALPRKRSFCLVVDNITNIGIVKNRKTGTANT